MLPRAYWKGWLKLSLVSCPVALYPATTTAEKTRFHMINTETGNRLRQQMVDVETGDIVEKENKGRGYEIAKGNYVPIDKEDIEAIQLESNDTLDIDSFVPREEIDRRYLNHPYYVMPDGEAGVDAFAVIRDAMKNKERVALARVVLSNREHVVAIEPLGRGLLATTLRYPYEVRDESEFFDDIKMPKISKDMVELAVHILETKAAHFESGKFTDEYEDALKALIKRKASGKKIEVPKRAARGDNVIDLMEALRKSLKGGEGKSSSKSPSSKSPSTKSTSSKPSSQAPRRAAKKAGRSSSRIRKAG